MKKALFQNKLIASLSEYCKKYPRDEKVFIVPNYQTGHQILEHLARSGVSWINFRLATVSSLALEIAGDILVSQKLRFINTVGTEAIVEGIFNELADAGKLQYFEKHPINKGMVEALTKTVRELRIAGIVSEQIKPGAIKYAIKKEKENDIYLVLSSYEKMLADSRFSGREENKLIDRAGVINLAMKNIGKEPGNRTKQFCILPRHYLSGIEKEFIRKMCADNLIVLKEDEVYGLEQPEDLWSSGTKQETTECKSDIERLRWLFDADKAPESFKDGSIEMFGAVGHRNEIREVIRRIIAENQTADNSEVVCTGIEGYADAIYSLCQKLNIPVTFAGGIPIYLTASGRTFIGFLLWIREDFSEIYLRRMFESGDLKLDGKAGDDFPGSSVLGHLLRTAGVGWGRERYSRAISGKIEECKVLADEAKKEGEEERVANYEKRAKNLTVLKKICEDILSLVPETKKEEKIDFGVLCQACIGFLDKYARASSEKDAVVIKSAKEQLELLAGVTGSKILFEEAMEKLLNIAMGMRIMASGPLPGHLHISHYKSGGISGRPRIFIVGFDESRLQTRISQDPILLDEEREKISEKLMLSGESARQNILDMASLIAGLRGKLTFSYSAYDTKEERRSFPSSLLLQVFRIKEGKPEADYNEFFQALGEPAGFDESKSTGIHLDETDWWLDNLTEKETLKDGTESFKKIYVGIKEGLTAMAKRESEELTEYDGKIKAAEDELDPRKRKGLVMSASRLECAAKCPFQYFIKYVLGVELPEETEKDVTVWLDPMERGSLLHEVFQKFTDKYLIGKDDETDEKKHIVAIEKILDEAVEIYKGKIPPPNDVVFKNEARQLKRDINIFLKVIKELGTKPFKCEVMFGYEKEEPVKIPVGGGNIMLRGRIDRIDKTGKSEFHVWDYKTGGMYYKTKEPLKGGEQLQHCLYAFAAKCILKKMGEKDAEVVKSGYIFPTEKGLRDGNEVILERNPKDTGWQEVLAKLMEIISKGVFTVADKKDACKLCDYAVICDNETAQGQKKKKMVNESNVDLNAWKELKEYE